MYDPKRSIATMRGVRAKLRDSLDAVCYRTISCRTEQFDFGLMRLLTLSFQCRLQCPETTRARCGMKPSPSLAPAVAGMIEPHVLYRCDSARAQLGWKSHAWRTATRNGLRTLRAGGRVYVLGRDIIEYLDRVNSPGGDR